MDAFFNLGDQTKEHPETLKKLGYDVEVRELPNPKRKTDEDPETIKTAFVQVNGFVEPSTKSTVVRGYRDPSTKEVIRNEVEVDCVDFSTEELQEAALEAAVDGQLAIRYSDYVLFPNGKVLNSQFAAGQLDVLGCLVMHDPESKKKAKPRKVSAFAQRLLDRNKGK